MSDHTNPQPRRSLSPQERERQIALRREALGHLTRLPFLPESDSSRYVSELVQRYGQETVWHAQQSIDRLMGRNPLNEDSIISYAVSGSGKRLHLSVASTL